MLIHCDSAFTLFIADDFEEALRLCNHHAETSAPEEVEESSRKRKKNSRYETDSSDGDGNGWLCILWVQIKTTFMVRLNRAHLLGVMILSSITGKYQVNLLLKIKYKLGGLFAL